MNDLVKESVLETGKPNDPRKLSRRFFLKGSSAAVASAGAATLGTVAVVNLNNANAQEATPASGATPDAGTMPGMGTTERPAAFFNLHEAATVDAIVSRILPGDESDPGAHEAGVVFYIDRNLGGTNLGYSLKTYTQGPFPIVSEDPVPVEQSSARYPYDAVHLPASEAARYGYQSVLTPQDVYRRGLTYVDAFAQATFQKDFVDLAADQQDQVLSAMDDDSATGFDGPSAKGFFTQLRNDTIEGMFSDPMYGGNRDLAGWRLIGYPGAQRIYTPDDMKNANFQRDPQSLAMLIANEGH